MFHAPYKECYSEVMVIHHTYAGDTKILARAKVPGSHPHVGDEKTFFILNFSGNTADAYERAHETARKLARTDS
jgi:hypothetical protein